MSPPVLVALVSSPMEQTQLIVQSLRSPETALTNLFSSLSCHISGSRTVEEGRANGCGTTAEGRTATGRVVGAKGSGGAGGGEARRGDGGGKVTMWEVTLREGNGGAGAATGAVK